LQVSRWLSSEFPEMRERQGEGIPGDPRQRVPIPAPRTARRAPLGAIIFPRRGSSDRLTPMSQTVALAELIVQSTQVLLADRETPRHFARLRDVIASVPSFRLEHTEKQLHDIAHTLRGAAI
jgi:hypothetical protein